MKRDLTTKVMTKCKDVFSDICNVNLFGSRKVIRPEDLEVAESNVVYRDMAGVFREHRMDVRMKHKVSNAEIALYCLENQSEVSNIMPVRDMGYLYSGYNEQIRKIKNENELAGMRYYTKVIGDNQKLTPVISLVLYYGVNEWTGPKNLKEMLDISKEWQAELEPLIENHRIKLVYLAGQSDEKRKGYKSDFRHIVDYLFFAKRKDARKLREMTKDTTRKIIHPQEYLHMMNAITGDKKYMTIADEFNKQGSKGETKRCIMMDMVEERGIKKGMESINLLNIRLIQEGRFEDVKKASKDEALQKRFMKEYGI